MRFPHPPWGGRPPADYRVDRPEVEAPRGAREPTGTNWPTLNNNTPITGETQNKHSSSTTVRITTNPHPPNTRGNVENINTVDQLAAVKAWGKRPASIPNPEAKPHSADGTAPGRVWESRTPPQHNNTRPPQTHTFEGAKQHPQTQHTNTTTTRQTHNTQQAHATHNIHTSTTRQ